MKFFSNSFKRDYILIAASFILLGVLFLVFPDTSSKIICYTAGGMVCLVGLVKIIEYFKTPVSLAEYSLSLVIGLTAVGVGAYVIIKPEALLGVLPTVLGVAVILDGMIKLQNTLDMLRLKDRRWWLTLIVAAVTLGLGVVLILNPFKAAEMLTQFIGIALIVTGICDLVALIGLSARLRAIEKERTDWLKKLKTDRDKDSAERDNIAED